MDALFHTWSLEKLVLAKSITCLPSLLAKSSRRGQRKVLANVQSVDPEVRFWVWEAVQWQLVSLKGPPTLSPQDHLPDIRTTFV